MMLRLAQGHARAAMSRYRPASTGQRISPIRGPSGADPAGSSSVSRSLM